MRTAIWQGLFIRLALPRISFKRNCGNFGGTALEFYGAIARCIRRYAASSP